MIKEKEITFFDFLLQSLPDLKKELDTSGCWDYKIHPPYADDYPRITVHISTGKTHKLQTYSVIYDMPSNTVTCEILK